MELKIALLQLLPGKTPEDNLFTGKKACIEAKEKGADIALFPEMWSDGYYLPQDEEELRKLAIEKDSSFIKEFRDLAAELEMAIGITFLESHDPKPLNSVIFFDRTGKEILHYSKVHTCAFSDEAVLSGGDDFYVADLDFGRGTVKFGSMICFDREFPESARILRPTHVRWRSTGWQLSARELMRTCSPWQHATIPRDSLTATGILLFSTACRGLMRKTG